jgi:hypothetical protein
LIDAGGDGFEEIGHDYLVLKCEPLLDVSHVHAAVWQHEGLFIV